ncbi:TlpA family protein disulfide reductase [Lewinella cohaerens]|uniref:TlpA family protein disulfide reductase n=1 Tax=Lewinella cohaerens TaxID=70995 RepID=UPI0003617521|nr:thioredoxin-like domain-containing protein [Lewinella cohaerens]
MLSLQLKAGICFGVFFFVSLVANSQTTLFLQDTLLFKGSLTYSGSRSNLAITDFEFNLDTFSSGRITNIHSLEIHNLLRGEIAEAMVCRPIYYAQLRHQGHDYLVVDNDGDAVFQQYDIYPLPFLDPLLLQFHPFGDEDAAAIIDLSVKIKFDGGNIYFSPYQLYTSTIQIEGASYDVTVWPFLPEVKIKVGGEGDFKLLSAENNYYKEHEVFALAGRRFKFSAFDYHQKTIQLEELAKDEPLYGYKTGTFFYEWVETDNTSINWDSLGIDRTIPHLVYFGAKWCGACQEELPKLQSLYPLLQRNGMDMVSVTAQHRESDAEIMAYTSEREIPGISVVESMDGINTLIRYLEVDRYPTYVFIAPITGEILYRSDSSEMELHEFLYEFLK